MFALSGLPALNFIRGLRKLVFHHLHVAMQTDFSVGWVFTILKDEAGPDCSLSYGGIKLGTGNGHKVHV